MISEWLIKILEMAATATALVSMILIILITYAFARRVSPKQEKDLNKKKGGLKI